MAGFVFRLQNVLDYRTSLADRARQELGALQASLREAQEHLVALQRAEQRALRSLNHTQTAAMLDLPEVTRLLEYGEVLATQIAAQRQEVEARQRAVDAQQEQFVALSKDAKALEKLRDRQIEEFQQEDGRREQAETSEIASGRHQRQQVS
jgi:flagellar export protein FliJ